MNQSNLYYYDLGREHRTLKSIGICSQLRILNAFISYYKENNLLFIPKFTINNIDYYDYFFKKNNINNILNFVNHVNTPNTLLSYSVELERNYIHNFKNNIIFSDEFSKKCEAIYANIGAPRIGINIRETDKSEESYVALPTCLYEKIVLNNLSEKIFITSDCNYSINQLKNKFNNIITLNTSRSENFLPLHRMHHIKLNQNKNISEFTQMEELFIELYILTKLDTLYYGMVNGVTIAASLLNPNLKTVSVVSLIDNEEIINILKYYKLRETFLWKIIDEEINTNCDY